MASQRVLAELQLLLVSTAIVGEQDYLARKGIFNVNNTLGIGIGNTSEIIFRSGGLKTNLTFSTRECLPGEIEAGNICLPCLTDQYSFNTSGTCSDCENHAKCSGGSTLVPVDGYWHSTPFSPQFHECIIKEACKRADRETVLKAYYKDSNKISADIATLNAYILNKNGTTPRPSYDDYVQCSPGYEGILCGSCEAGYGHSAGGECVKCPNSRRKAIELTAISTGINFIALVLAVLSMLKSFKNIFQTRRQADNAPVPGQANGGADIVFEVHPLC